MPVDLARMTRREPAVRAGPLLEISDLTITLRTRDAVIDAVRGVDLTIARAETVALVGESGSGKTMTGLALMGLVPREISNVGGSIQFADLELVGMSERAFRRIRGNRIAMVFQDPHSSLNPRVSIGRQLSESIRAHQQASRRSATGRAIDLLSQVGIRDPTRRIHDYPHEFSGGMLQRALIAMAISCNPDLLIADEPTTALDVTIQAQIMDLLMRLREELGMAMMFITHNVALASSFSSRIAVMYAGRIVETGSTAEIIARPSHPYTYGLINSLPAAGTKRGQLRAIPGSPPDPSRKMSGCAFRERCGWAEPRCAEEDPKLRGVRTGGAAACFVLPSFPAFDLRGEERS